MRGNLTTDRQSPPQPLRRKPGSRLPCGTCPKFGERDADKGPVAGALRDLSPRNQQTLQAFYQTRAANIRVSDPVTVRRFGMIERITERAAYRQRQVAADLLVAVLTRGTK